MRIKIFFLCVLFSLVACQKDENLAEHPHDVARPRQSDRKPNGGLLRFTLGEKAMHDSYFEAQFTPRGDVFEKDNLQLYNYNVNSDKYPRFIINVNYNESELVNWVDATLTDAAIAFTAAPNTPTMKADGSIKITKVTQRNVEGSFAGELYNPQTEKKFDIRGEFRAVLRINI